mmetsp:Transcript_13008/g.48229  ORF Transcript_13008/g.48229 Transcript_13008/m.48229 type:complete len:219 (-) Transcript_13008:1408-2064(-)
MNRCERSRRNGSNGKNESKGFRPPPRPPVPFSPCPFLGRALASPAWILLAILSPNDRPTPMRTACFLRGPSSFLPPPSQSAAGSRGRLYERRWTSSSWSFRSSAVPLLETSSSVSTSDSVSSTGSRGYACSSCRTISCGKMSNLAHRYTNSFRTDSRQFLRGHSLELISDRQKLSPRRSSSLESPSWTRLASAKSLMRKHMMYSSAWHTQKKTAWRPS